MVDISESMRHLIISSSLHRLSLSSFLWAHSFFSFFVSFALVDTFGFADCKLVCIICSIDLGPRNHRPLLPIVRQLPTMLSLPHNGKTQCITGCGVMWPLLIHPVEFPIVNANCFGK